MKSLMTLAFALCVGAGVVGCEKKATTEQKSETTTKTPAGSTTTSIDKKVETTPNSETKTTTEKTQTTPAK